MRALKLPFLLALASAFVTGTTVRATTLVGTQVTGALYFPGFPENYFDPVNGRVPAGYLNVAGITVTISSTDVEFGFADSTATVTADFNAAQLIVTYQPVFTAHYNPVQLSFTNSAFSSLSTASDGFPNGGMVSSLSGNVISLNWAGGDVTSGQNLQAVFNVNLPPSPLLSVQITPTNAVVISWPDPSTGFNLQQNSGFNPANWVNVANTPIVANGLKQVVVSPPVGTQFYRLKYP